MEKTNERKYEEWQIAIEQRIARLSTDSLALGHCVRDYAHNLSNIEWLVIGAALHQYDATHMVARLITKLAEKSSDSYDDGYAISF